MNLVDLIPDLETRAAVGSFLVLAGCLVPIARKVALATRTKVDDRIVDAIDTALAFIPRVKIGK